MLKGLGWVRAPKDERAQDLKLNRHKPAFKAAVLPASYDPRDKWPTPYDQGDLGSCTGNGCAGVAQYALIKEGKQNGKNVNTPAETPSRLFIYYNERVIEHSVNEDAGAQVKDGLKTLHATGVCFEDSWPYNVAKFKSKPPAKCYTVAAGNKVTQYAAVDGSDITELKTALANDTPVVFGFTVYESFENIGADGMMPMPAEGEQVMGGHCVVAIGYDDAKQCVLVRNSWGPGWGLGGYFWMPYAFITDDSQASDFWVVEEIA